MACRVIVINSEKDVIDFFYFLKGTGGDKSEAMDQFIRRIMARAIVYRVPDSDERVVTIGKMEETDAYKIDDPNGHSWNGEPNQLTLHHDFTQTDDSTKMQYDDAIAHLTNIAMSNNKLK